MMTALVCAGAMTALCLPRRRAMRRNCASRRRGTGEGRCAYASLAADGREEVLPAHQNHPGAPPQPGRSQSFSAPQAVVPGSAQAWVSAGEAVTGLIIESIFIA